MLVDKNTILWNHLFYFNCYLITTALFKPFFFQMFNHCIIFLSHYIFHFIIYFAVAPTLLIHTIVQNKNIKWLWLYSKLEPFPDHFFRSKLSYHILIVTCSRHTKNLKLGRSQLWTYYIQRGWPVHTHEAFLVGWILSKWISYNIGVIAVPCWNISTSNNLYTFDDTIKARHGQS